MDGELASLPRKGLIEPYTWSVAIDISDDVYTELNPRVSTLLQQLIRLTFLT